MLSKVIAAIVRGILEFLARRIVVKSEKPVDKQKVREAGMKKVGKPPKLPLLLFPLLLFTGCYSDEARIVMIDQTGVVRLLEDSGRVKVLIQTESGWEAGRVSIPAGWYAMSLTDDEIEGNDGR